MAQQKYGNLVVRKSLVHFEGLPGFCWMGEADYQSAVSFIITLIKEPAVVEEYPHSHDFDLYLHFLSCNPDDMDRLPAEIEMSLGEEREMYTITSPASVHIPKGLIHCPLIFKRVDKPIILFHTTIAPRYTKDPTLIIKD
ncbi:MAG: hypothetical protein JXA87_06750 [Thermoleophilia bacterium]|nr:hypothetical protein [Thermoleophilia bacterium]